VAFNATSTSPVAPSRLQSLTGRVVIDEIGEASPLAMLPEAWLTPLWAESDDAHCSSS